MVILYVLYWEIRTLLLERTNNPDVLCGPKQSTGLVPPLPESLQRYATLSGHVPFELPKPLISTVPYTSRLNINEHARRTNE